MSNYPVVVGVLERNYRNKFVVIQIRQDTGLARILYTGCKLPLIRRSNHHRIPYFNQTSKRFRSSDDYSLILEIQLINLLACLKSCDYSTGIYHYYYYYLKHLWVTAPKGAKPVN